MKRLLKATIICFVLLFCLTGGLSAAEITDFDKDETVYLNLNSDGSIKEVLVVNHIATPTEGTYVDYGEYSSIENITDKTVPEVKDNKIIWNLPANESGFYYIGKMKTQELPWIFDFTYTLNNKAVTAEELRGASGNVKIKLHAVPNEKVASYFQKNFAMQLSLSLDTDICKDITAENSTTVLTGKKKTVSYMTMPQGTLNATISMNVTNLTMDGISIVLSPFSLSNFSTFTEMEDGVDTLLNAMTALIDGTSQLQNGLDSASDGMKQLNQGSNELANTKTEVTSGMNQYQQGISALSGYVSGFSSEMETALKTFDEISGKMEQAKTQLSAASKKIEGAIANIDASATATQQQIAALESGLNGLSTGLENLESGINQIMNSNNGLNDILTDFLNNYQTLQSSYGSLLTQLNSLSLNTASANAIINNESESAEAKALAQSYLELANGIVGIKSSLSTLNGNFTTANTQFGNAIAAISAGYTSLNTGLENLKTSITALKSGLGSGFDFSGIKNQLSTLNNEIKNTANIMGQFDLSAYNIDTKDYQKNMTALSQAVAALDEKFGTLNFAVSNQVYGGITKINDGFNTLYSGFKEVPDQVGTLNDGQKQLKNGMDKAIGSIFDSDSDNKIVSFAAPEAFAPKTVQFIGATPAITEDTTVYQETEEVETTLWERIKQLFQ